MKTHQKLCYQDIDIFKDICLRLFEDQIISRLDIKAPPIPMETIGPFLSEYKIFSKFDTSLPILVNRDIPPSGYWDHPINWIPSGENHTICPICFFDFGTLEWRKMEYLRVKIINCKSNPELNGRDALVKLDNVEIEVAEPPARAGAGSNVVT